MSEVSSEATKELTELVGRLSLQRRKLPKLKLYDLAYGLFEWLSNDAEKLDRVLASANLNSKVFLTEAKPERRELHEAILLAAKQYQVDHLKKERRRGAAGR